jgi:hypothetical protein
LSLIGRITIEDFFWGFSVGDVEVGKGSSKEKENAWAGYADVINSIVPYEFLPVIVTPARNQIRTIVECFGCTVGTSLLYGDGETANYVGDWIACTGSGIGCGVEDELISGIILIGLRIG